MEQESGGKKIGKYISDKRSPETTIKFLTFKVILNNI